MKEERAYFLFDRSPRTALTDSFLSAEKKALSVVLLSTEKGLEEEYPSYRVSIAPVALAVTSRSENGVIKDSYTLPHDLKEGRDPFLLTLNETNPLVLGVSVAFRAFSWS